MTQASLKYMELSETVLMVFYVNSILTIGLLQVFHEQQQLFTPSGLREWGVNINGALREEKKSEERV